MTGKAGVAEGVVVQVGAKVGRGVTVWALTTRTLEQKNTRTKKTVRKDFFILLLSEMTSFSLLFFDNELKFVTPI